MSGHRRKGKDAPRVDPLTPPPSSTQASYARGTDTIVRDDVTLAAPTRREARRAAETMRQDDRKKHGRFVIAAVVVVLVLVVGWWFFGRDGSGSDGSTDGVVPQRTLLVQLQDDEGVAAASALVAETPGDGGDVVVLVPSRLLVEVPGFGSAAFGDALRLSRADSSSDALSDALGVSVDGSWVVTESGLAALVDAVGGVRVSVDVPILDDAGTAVLLQPGEQTLNGVSAAAFATYLGADEPEQARSARFGALLSELVAAFPEGPDAVQALATQAVASGSADPERAAEVLDGLRQALDDGSVPFQTLPVRSLDAGSGQLTYGIDEDAVEDLVASRLAGAVLAERDGGSLRVLVQNGVGTPGLGETAHDRLVDAGFRYAGGGNAGTFDYSASVVLIPDASTSSQQAGRDVAGALGLPNSAVQVASQGQSIADVVVVLGADYKP